MRHIAGVHRMEIPLWGEIYLYIYIFPLKKNAIPVGCSNLSLEIPCEIILFCGNIRTLEHEYWSEQIVDKLNFHASKVTR